MSLALIQESAKEVRRLAIAGSPLAVGDFRLKKLVAPLEQAGAKVPVFAQVAKAINDVVGGKEADSATNLLNLSTLLNAILYTQGQSGAAGDVRELETFPSHCSSTKMTARVLKPLIQALTNTGGGRYETIKSAVDRGAFNDLRLIDPAIYALGDNFPELADLVAENILPAYGPGIVPRLKTGFELKGKRHDARKLAVMHQLDPAGTLALCKTALEDGSPEVKIAAIACLGKHEDCLPLVLEQANAKNKQIRAAALEALAEHDRPEVTRIFTELVKGKTLDLLSGPFRVLRNHEVLNSLLAEGNRVLEELLKGDSEQIVRYSAILDCLVSRKEPEVQDFVLGCFARSDKLAKLKAAKNTYVAGDDLVERLARVLFEIGSPQTLAAILDKRKVLPSSVNGCVLWSALLSWTPAQVYEEFSPTLGQKKGVAKGMQDEIERFLVSAFWDKSSRYNPAFTEDIEGSMVAERFKEVELDPRWLDAAVKADADSIVYHLARPGHKGAVEYLLQLGDAKRTSDAGMIVRALARCQYPKVTDYFLSMVAKKTKSGKTNVYELNFLFENARHLPPADLPKLDEFAAKLDEKFVDNFLEALAPLRNTAAPNES